MLAATGKRIASACPRFSGCGRVCVSRETRTARFRFRSAPGPGTLIPTAAVASPSAMQLAGAGSETAASAARSTAIPGVHPSRRPDGRPPDHGRRWLCAPLTPSHCGRLRESCDTHRYATPALTRPAASQPVDRRRCAGTGVHVRGVLVDSRHQKVQSETRRLGKELVLQALRRFHERDGSAGAGPAVPIA